MSKRIPFYDYVSIDGVNLSNFARSVSFESTDEQVDVSGFNAGGTSEFLQGTRARQVTIEFFAGRGSNEVHQVLFPLHDGRTAFDFVWRPDVNTSVSATNEELRGSVRLLNFTEGGTRGEAETATYTFIEADATAPLTYHSS